jgi:hypothetical protein
MIFSETGSHPGPSPGQAFPDHALVGGDSRQFGETVMTSFNVASIDPKERSLRWSRFVSEIFFPLSASFAAPDRFHGTIENWDMGRISLSRFCSGPVCYDRAKRHLGGRSNDDLLITFATRTEASFTQGDHDLRCKRNGFFLERGDLPYRFSHSDDNEFCVPNGNEG